MTEIYLRYTSSNRSLPKSSAVKKIQSLKKSQADKKKNAQNFVSLSMFTFYSLFDWLVFFSYSEINSVFFFLSENGLHNLLCDSILIKK